MIQVKHLSKKFGELEVLKDVNCHIEKGEVVSIIGPSGTGKSTLLRCLNLLETPTTGSIIIDGTDILAPGADVPKIRRKMGMVFQSFNLYAHLSVMDNITLGPVRLLNKSREEAEKKGYELLRMVGLAEKVNNFPDELSGGQKQRVAIARCLAMEPKIMLFDEPTSALDPKMVKEVVGVIRRLASEGMTMVIVTHEMDLARNVSSRVFYMDEGIIYEDGPPSQIFENPQKEKTRLFIGKIHTFQYNIANKNFDFYGMNGEISDFCSKYLSPKTVQNVLLLTEELVFLYEPPLTLVLDYSEKTERLSLSIKSDWVLVNPLNEDSGADEFGRAIINGIAENIKVKQEERGYVLSMEVKGS